MIKVRIENKARLCQGDIIRDVEYVEYVSETNGIIEVSKIVFPLVIVLSQDCDLEQDYRVRWSRETTSNNDKELLSVLVAPLYNVEFVYTGEQLSELGQSMQTINKAKSQGELLRKNNTLRYHYLEFPDEIQIVPIVIDFKHFFSMNVAYLKKTKTSHFVCRVADLYREDISQRFAAFLSRIGLPNIY